MPSLADLHDTIQATLAGGRLGRPVFLRYLIRGNHDAATIGERLAQTVALAGTWLGQSLATVYTLGSLESGHVSVTLAFEAGATALVAYARTPPADAGVDVLLLGNHGALYHEAGPSEYREEAIGRGSDTHVLNLWLRSLQPHQPEALRPENGS